MMRVLAMVGVLGGASVSADLIGNYGPRPRPGRPVQQGPQIDRGACPLAPPPAPRSPTHNVHNADERGWGERAGGTEGLLVPSWVEEGI